MLEIQLPPHDSDPKYCRTLNEDEKNELRIFNEQQRHNALGRGSARQLPLTQSPMPCRGVCHSSFHFINTY
jgi:prickle